MAIVFKGIVFVFQIVLAILLVYISINHLKDPKGKKSIIMASIAIVIAAVVLLAAFTTIALTPELRPIFLLWPV